VFRVAGCVVRVTGYEFERRNAICNTLKKPLSNGEGLFRLI